MSIKMVFVCFWFENYLWQRSSVMTELYKELVWFGHMHLFIDIKIFLPEVSTANGTHSNKQTRFSMHQDDFTSLYNILLQLVGLRSGI